MVAVTEADRLQTLEALCTEEEKLGRELSSMSITSTTLKHQKRVKGLQEKLREVTEAKKTFSREKVFLQST